MAVQTVEDYKVLIVKICNKYKIVIPELENIENRHHALQVMLEVMRLKRDRDKLLGNICLN